MAFHCVQISLFKAPTKIKISQITVSLFLIKMHIRVLDKGDIGMGSQGHVLYVLDVTMYATDGRYPTTPFSTTV